MEPLIGGQLIHSPGVNPGLATGTCSRKSLVRWERGLRLEPQDIQPVLEKSLPTAETRASSG